MKAIRKIVAFTLMLQIWFSSIGYAVSRIECMVTGDALVQINDLSEKCLKELHPDSHECCTNHKESKHTSKIRKRCCNKDSKSCDNPLQDTNKSETGKAQLRNNCCKSTILDVHLENGDNIQTENSTYDFRVLPILLVCSGLVLFESGEAGMLNDIESPPILFKTVTDRLSNKSVWII